MDFMSKKVKSSPTVKLVLSALMASLCCVLTMLVHIPVPATGGYVNLGDTAVILSGWFLGPLWGALSAGLGSALADLLSGYPQYAPATFVIKALMALVFFLVIKAFDKISKKSVFAKYAVVVLAGALAEILMVLGYLFVEALLMGYGAGALAAVLPNAIQGLCGLLGGAFLITIFSKTGIKEKLLKS